MRRALVVLGAIGLTAAGVWWAVTSLPRAAPEQRSADSVVAPPAPPREQRSSTPRRLVPAAPPSSAALMERLPPLGGACGGACGTIRWAVKTLSDPDRDLVGLIPVDATVEQLVAMQRPADLPAFGRAPPAELTVYRVRGYLGGWSPQRDGDIHVVLYGLVDQRASLVTEIPDPSCGGVCASGLGPWYVEARLVLDSILSRPNPEDRPIVIEITGVGFWDRREHANGSAPNGIELHPVLRLREVSRD